MEKWNWKSKYRKQYKVQHMPCPNKGSHRHEKRKTGCLLDISSSRMFKNLTSSSLPTRGLSWLSKLVNSMIYCLVFKILSGFFLFTSIIIKGEMLSALFIFPHNLLFTYCFLSPGHTLGSSHADTTATLSCLPTSDSSVICSVTLDSFQIIFQ